MGADERIGSLVEEKQSLLRRLADIDAELQELLGDAVDPLTDRQFRMLAYIESEIVNSGFPPSVREIGNHMGIRSTNGVHGFLRALERKGWIARVRGHSRSIRVLRSTRASA